MSTMLSRVPVTLTYRPSASGRIHAAYLGDCRVGYLEHRITDRWLYQLSLVHPHGGGYIGTCDTREEAEDMLERSLRHWLTSAGLAYKRTPTI